MPYKDKARQREYQREWMARRRLEWFEENGPCVDCGSWEKLELDHVDPKTKITHSIWSYTKDKRDQELAKCVARCHDCHIIKTRNNEEGGGQLMRVVSPIGMSWCSTCKKHKPIEEFSRNKKRYNGRNHECRVCKNKWR